MRLKLLKVGISDLVSDKNSQVHEQCEREKAQWPTRSARHLRRVGRQSRRKFSNSNLLQGLGTAGLH